MVIKKISEREKRIQPRYSEFENTSSIEYTDENEIDEKLD